MKKILLISGVLLALTATVASAGGINLAWTDCFGAGGTTARTFACASNTGNNDLYVSFDPGVNIPDLVGSNPIIDLQSATPIMPDWWQFKNSGSCRLASLSAITAITGTCVDTWAGQGVPGIAAYYTTGVLPSMPDNRTRILASISEPGAAASNVDPGTEYFCVLIRVNNAKTTGLGACNGCQTPVCLVLNEVFLGGLNSPPLYLVNALASNYATWQGGLAGDPNCLATPTINKTWGQVKSIYR